MYSNLPSVNSSNDTLLAFKNYNQQPIEIDPTVFAAFKGFFTNKDFSEVSSDSISTILIAQAKKDGYNPMTILDTLKNLNDVELSSIVAEILNYNRVKTSSLGIGQTFTTHPEVLRNIIV
jgi:hypothetical protein